MNINGEETVKKLEQEREICALYIDSAKTYTQLSTGALVLSLAFAKNFLGKPEATLLSDWPLLLAWLCWLFAVLVGVTYEYCVIKYLEMIAHENQLLYWPRTWSILIPKSFTDQPYHLYGLMMGLFYSGTLVFFVVAVVRIF